MFMPLYNVLSYNEYMVTCTLSLLEVLRVQQHFTEFCLFENEKTTRLNYFDQK